MLLRILLAIENAFEIIKTLSKITTMLKKKITAPYYEVIKTPRKWIGTLTQTGTNNVVPNPILNEFTDPVITFERDSTGKYIVTWDGFNDTINTIFLMPSTQGIILASEGVGVLNIETKNLAGTYSDDMLSSAYCEITAYQILS